MEREGPGAAARAMLPKLFAPNTAERRPELVSHWEQQIANAPAAGIIAATRGLAERPDARPYLPQIAQPTLVVVGEHDAISPVTEMRELASQIPQSHFAVIPTAGH